MCDSTYPSKAPTGTLFYRLYQFFGQSGNRFRNELECSWTQFEWALSALPAPYPSKSNAKALLWRVEERSLARLIDPDKALRWLG